MQLDALWVSMWERATGRCRIYVARPNNTVTRCSVLKTGHHRMRERERGREGNADTACENSNQDDLRGERRRALIAVWPGSVANVFIACSSVSLHNGNIALGFWLLHSMCKLVCVT